ncbi:MAG: hypothetical protein IPJ41_15225 [Phycisphaerales bacterium]|nr:hypothetical protein [Phycisphaerales bacterium]
MMTADGEPIGSLREIELDWAGQEILFVHLLKLRDLELASALFGGSSPPRSPGLGELEVGPIDWWLEWAGEVGRSGKDVWFIDQLGSLFAVHLSREAQDQFVAEFNRVDSQFRSLLLHFVLPHRNDLTTSVFSEEAISFLLADLNRAGSVTYFRHLLSQTATEEFVTERLLPLLATAGSPLLENLRLVLKRAGSRHGRRYLLH